ncbi:MAG TPA: serine/threonine protein kinase, partial [Deltaproteobacteria bacterium]|nr:serine/threonine protein kinase [Deltaproteobacteria bacterium]
MDPTDRGSGEPAAIRRFRILGLLGQGGFGVVYRASLDTPGQASQTVALKVLHHGMSDDVLRRFRDEARMLELIEDRAIVSVQQPTRIDGSWVIVMECVEGATVAQLLAHSVVPPRPALTIVGEIARALDHVYHQPGEDGRPLELLHRDLKTSNILLTPDGDVRLLDFGIARASFSGREASTQFGSDVIGTPGYVAPERFEGIEGPEGDVFSLGVTLYAMLTGARATRIDRRILDRIEDPGSRDTLALALHMCEPERAERPTAREVHQRARELASQTPGSALATWAWRWVPPAQAEARRRLEAQVQGDPPALIDTVLVEVPGSGVPDPLDSLASVSSVVPRSVAEASHPPSDGLSGPAEPAEPPAEPAEPPAEPAE